jgi:very-short-patch-repair endonuclease
MDLREVLERLGGVADRATLVRLTSRREVDRALRDGSIVRDSHGRYATALADSGQRAANALGGVLSHRSAALHWGWEVKTVPAAPDVMLPRNRKVSQQRRERVTLHRGTLRPDEVRGLVTTPRRSLVDCMRSLPFGEALAVADSAMRHGDVTREKMHEVAAEVRGTGAPQCRRIAACASPLAANPFESALRAIALDVPGIDVVPQVMIRARDFSVQPDLVDEGRRLVLEADSFGWHGHRQALRVDARRYNNLVVRDWRVLRFAWEDVMHDENYVRQSLIAVAELVNRRTSSASRGRKQP